MAAGEALLPIEVPPLSAGAPLPHVFADEDKLLVAYIVNKTDPSFDGTNPRSVSPVTNGQSVAILTAKPCLALQFGLPNDEALSGHRLYKLGLQPYAAFEVLNSSWIGSLEQQIEFTVLISLGCFLAIGTSSSLSTTRRLNLSRRAFR
ncbi:hypothetical protein NKH70_15555 [Mesorhizobium sp. M0991]|uniref:hypothetical protein n=1 Tax=unclassified Mesorhizobium TaxID=325217 RepID=UPI00333B427D